MPVENAPSNELIDSAALANRVQELEGELHALRQELNAAHAKQQAGDEIFRRFSDSGMIGIAAFDAPGKFLFANRAMVQMIGCAAEDITAGKVSWDMLTPPEGTQRAQEAMNELHSQGSCAPYEAQYLRADGSHFWALFTGIMMDAQSAVAFLLDVTERVQAEEKLRLQARRLAELYDAASLRAAQLVEADRLKDQFLAMLAHELRNPLGAMRNAIQVAQRAQPGSHAFQRSQAILDRQSQHMTRLVDDLLDVSRISRGKIELRRTRLDLVALAQETCEDHRRMLEAAGLFLTTELPVGPLWIRGDATRLGQSLGNLLQNAAKFTDPGGSVSVRIVVESSTTRRRQKQEVVVAVSDTGIGIPRELLPRLFEPFVQADQSLARTQGGLGLGLALVKGIVELHGGHVCARSDGLGRGASFLFHLPLPSDVPEEPLAVPLAASARTCQILIIEDNPDAAETMRALLELAGHQVDVAYSGPSGVERARQTGPDIVLCDLGLPGMDGYEVVTALRQNPATAHARLIAVSGYAQAADQRRSARAGFELHLTKPVDPALLHQALLAHRTG